MVLQYSCTAVMLYHTTYAALQYYWQGADLTSRLPVHPIDTLPLNSAALHCTMQRTALRSRALY